MQSNALMSDDQHCMFLGKGRRVNVEYMSGMMYLLMFRVSVSIRALVLHVCSAFHTVPIPSLPLSCVNQMTKYQTAGTVFSVMCSINLWHAYDILLDCSQLPLICLLNLLSCRLGH